MRKNGKDDHFIAVISLLNERKGWLSYTDYVRISDESRLDVVIFRLFPIVSGIDFWPFFIHIAYIISQS